MTKEDFTILIVDDDADIRDLLKLLLEHRGYTVHVAADGVDALEQLQNGLRPKVILLDLMMPRMDGEQFLKRIRSTPFGKTPVVILSGHSTAHKVAGELAVDHCLMKPVEFSELLKTVERFAGELENGAA